jgi:hypothetical protein
VRRAQGFTAAQTAGTKSLAMFRDLFAKDPHKRDFRFELAVCGINLGNLYARNDQAEWSGARRTTTAMS